MQRLSDFRDQAQKNDERQDKAIGIIQMALDGNGDGIKSRVARIETALATQQKIVWAILGLLLAHSVSLLLQGCTAGNVTPVSTATLTATATASQTATVEPTATVTETASPTLPAPTLATDTPTPDSSPSPTPIGAQPTGAIIEVTAFPDRPTEGFYTPNVNVWVRTCPKVAEECRKIRLWYAGMGERIYGMYIEKDSGDTWLSPDVLGQAWAAYLIGADILGEWIPF
jgi:hypothetical protein